MKTKLYRASNLKSTITFLAFNSSRKLRHTQNGVGSYSVLPRPLKSSSCYLKYFSVDLVQSFFPLSCSQLSLTSVDLAPVQSLPFSLSLSLLFFFPLIFSSFSFHPTFPPYFPILCLPLFPPSFFSSFFSLFFFPFLQFFFSLFPLFFPLSFIFLLPSLFPLLFFLPFFPFRSSIFSFSPFLPSIFHFFGEE